jgi:hypothetical protein
MSGKAIQVASTERLEMSEFGSLSLSSPGAGLILHSDVHQPGSPVSGPIQRESIHNKLLKNHHLAFHNAIHTKHKWNPSRVASPGAINAL